MTRRIGLAGLGVALMTAACGSSSSSSSAVPGPPQTLGVQIDGKTDAFNAAFTAYFPNEVRAHPGDTVLFTSVFRGEPHSVMLGSLIDKGLGVFDDKAKAAGSPDQVDESAVPELAKIPPLVPDGPGDANQSTAQPCFLDSGDPPGPGATPCPKREQPDFSGNQTLYSSGFLPDAATFAVKLASGIRPGTYRYMCALHRENMQGKIDVVAPSAVASNPADATKAGEDQLQKKVAALQPAIDQATNSTQAGKVSAGVFSPDPAHDAEGTAFLPKVATVPVGGSITWNVMGPHTIAFNAPEDARPDLIKAADGSVHENPKAVAPTGTKGVPPPASPGASPGAATPGTPNTATPGASPGALIQGAPDAILAQASSAGTSPGASPGGSPGGPPGNPPFTFKLTDLGAVSGTSFWNTGIVLSFPPQLTAVKIHFPRAGTYQYKCLIHTDMEGTVKVGS